MKLRLAALCALGALWLSGADPRLTRIRNIYVLPMSGGFDQYLANKLVQSGRYQVVTDPEQAEAILTDQIGRDFEDRLTELYPPPAPPEPPPSAKEEKKEPEDNRIGTAMAEAQGATRRTSSFARGRGNVFLIDRSSRQVLWSTYLRPRNTRPDELDGVADEMVGRLNGAAKAEIKRMKREEEQASKGMRPAIAIVEPAPAPAATAPVAAPPAAPVPAPPSTTTATPPAATAPATPAPAPAKPN